MQADQEEYNSRMENQTWTLVDRPEDPNVNILRSMWVWKIKEDDQRNIRFKARLVVVGWMQKEGIDFDETCAPVIRFETLRLVLLLADIMGLKVKQYDFVTAFLNAPMDRKLYIKQPIGFVVKGQECKVCLLLKSIYGLRKAPKEWSSTLHSFLVKMGLKRCWKDYGLYFMYCGTHLVLVTVYVDDMLVIGRDCDIEYVASTLMKPFKMKELGNIRYLLGIEINYEMGKRITFSQEKYVEDILKKFHG